MSQLIPDNGAGIRSSLYIPARKPDILHHELIQRETELDEIPEDFKTISSSR
jgi:hypothetical protein